MCDHLIDQGIVEFEVLACDAVPCFGLGMSWRGPRMRATRPTVAIISGTAMHLRTSHQIENGQWSRDWSPVAPLPVEVQLAVLDCVREVLTAHHVGPRSTRGRALIRFALSPR